MGVGIYGGDPRSFPSSDGKPPWGGNKFFFGANRDRKNSEMLQDIRLAPKLAPAVMQKILRGQAKFNLSGWLGGFGGFEDRMELYVYFAKLRPWKKMTGEYRIMVEKMARNSDTKMVFRALPGLVPRQARAAVVGLKCYELSGNFCSGFADRLSFTVE